MQIIKHRFPRLIGDKNHIIGAGQGQKEKP
jgi:hypothetical protein